MASAYVIEIHWHRAPGQATSRTYYLAGAKPGNCSQEAIDLAEYITDALRFTERASAEVVAFMVAGEVREVFFN